MPNILRDIYDQITAVISKLTEISSGFLNEKSPGFFLEILPKIILKLVDEFIKGCQF